MRKLTTLNTKLLLAAIAAVAALAAVALVEISPWPPIEPGARTTPAPREAESGAGLRIWDPPRVLAEARFTDATGQQVGLSVYRGKVILLNFWATWCEPCKQEMPSLLRLEQRLGGPDFAVVAVSGDRNGKAAVEPYAAEHGLSGLTFLYDPALAAARRLGVTGLPTTLLIGRDGRELGRAEGALDWESSAIAEAIAAKLRTTAESAAP
jgi:thiol-disulfide isomerase/thioredoxin